MPWLTPEEYARESHWNLAQVRRWANRSLSRRRCSMMFDERDIERGGDRLFRVWYQAPNAAGEGRPRMVPRPETGITFNRIAAGLSRLTGRGVGGGDVVRAEDVMGYSDEPGSATRLATYTEQIRNAMQSAQLHEEAQRRTNEIYSRLVASTPPISHTPSPAPEIPENVQAIDAARLYWDHVSRDSLSRDVNVWSQMSGVYSSGPWAVDESLSAPGGPTSGQCSPTPSPSEPELSVGEFPLPF